MCNSKYACRPIFIILYKLAYLCYDIIVLFTILIVGLIYAFTAAVIYMKTSARRYDTIVLGLLKKEEEEELEEEYRRRRVPNRDFFYFARCVRK